MSQKGPGVLPYLIYLAQRILTYLETLLMGKVQILENQNTHKNERQKLSLRMPHAKQNFWNFRQIKM